MNFYHTTKRAKCSEIAGRNTSSCKNPFKQLNNRATISNIRVTYKCGEFVRSVFLRAMWEKSRYVGEKGFITEWYYGLSMDANRDIKNVHVSYNNIDNKLCRA